jgi:hypothetical protein
MAAALALLAPLTAQAQVTQNPTTSIWDHETFATATRYEMRYYLLPVKADNTCDLTATPGATAYTIADMGKPATTTGIAMSAPITVKPIGCFVARVRALDASGLWSLESLNSNPFVYLPPAPSGLAVK